MKREKRSSFHYRAIRCLQILVTAFMLGLSNVILEETRMIDASATRIEVVEELPDDEPR